MVPTSDGPPDMTADEWRSVMSRRDQEVIRLNPADVERLTLPCPGCVARDATIKELRFLLSRPAPTADTRHVSDCR